MKAVKRAECWVNEHPRLFDVSAALSFTVIDTALTLLGTSWWPTDPGPLAWALLGVQAAVCLSLIVRRRHPMAVMGVFAAYVLVVTLLVSPFGVLEPVSSQNVWAPVATILAAYGPVVDYRSRQAAFAWVTLLTLLVARPWEPSVAVITVAVLRTAIGPLVALYLEARRRLVQALTERAERAEREQHLLAEQARADERARLAGEMHDVVTHRVSLMVLQAGALRVTAPDEATRRAAEELRAAGCQALEELRDLVGILRTSPDGEQPPEEDQAPDPAGFDALIAQAAAAGTPAELDSEGDSGLVSPTVGRTAYRVVREALTNVGKHAPGAPTVVRVRYDATGVRVTVRNGPPPRRPDPALAATGSRLGLAGLRQRIELVQGTMHAGFTAEGGFSVGVSLPAYVPTTERAVDQPVDQPVDPTAERAVDQPGDPTADRPLEPAPSVESETSAVASAKPMTGPLR